MSRPFIFLISPEFYHCFLNHCLHCSGVNSSANLLSYLLSYPGYIIQVSMLASMKVVGFFQLRT